MRCLFLLVVLAAGPLVRGAEVAAVSSPFQTGIGWILDVWFRNNDLGAVYNSATTSVCASLAEDIFALGNSSAASAQEMMNTEWTLTVRGVPAGEVDNGWSADAVGTTLHLTNNGLFPDFTYDVWQNTATNPNQDTMALRIGINNGLLESNGTAGYQIFGMAEVLDAGWDASGYDAIIVRSDSPMLSAPNYLGPHQPGPVEEVFVGVSASEFNSYPASGLQYLLLEPGDFAEWTDFATEHPALVAGADANGNGRSNFLDYASGQDPEAAGLLPIVELEGTTLTLRRRVDGIDAPAVAEYSDDLDDWFPLEEGVHYTVTSNTVTGPMRTLVLELLPGQPEKRFFRQRFGP